MTAAQHEATWHERRLARYLEARGEPGYVEALLGLKGVVVGGRHRIESLYDVGGESAVYIAQDLRDPGGMVRVAKIALLPVHRPIDLESREIRKQRDGLRVEAAFLRGSGSRFLPRHEGLFEFPNPLLDPARGGAFRESEPMLLMEKLPGCDLDRWLARMHRSDVPLTRMRRTLDRVSVVLLQALVDLYDRGLIYADLRPANLRIMGRPERLVRLLDAGSLVRIEDRSGRYPHVPSYLPPQLFRERLSGQTIVPSGESQAVMAGRTLFEAATGRVPHAGTEVDTRLLDGSNVSPPVAEVIEGLCRGDFAHVRHAYRYLVKRAARRVQGGNDPDRVTQRVLTLAPMGGKAPPAGRPAPMRAPAERPSPSRAVAERQSPVWEPAERLAPMRDPAPATVERGRWLARLLAFLRRVLRRRR